MEGVQAEGGVKETPQLHQVSVLVSSGRRRGRSSTGVPDKTEVEGQTC